MDMDKNEDDMIANDGFIQSIERDLKVISGQECEKSIISGLIDNSFENSEGIKHVDNHNVDTEVKGNDVYECSAIAKNYRFYFVKYQYYEEPNLKTKIEQVEKEIQKLDEVKIQTTEIFKAKKVERTLIIDHLRPLNNENIQFKHIISDKVMEIDALQTTLEDFHSMFGGGKEELDATIPSLNHHPDHEMNSLDEEKNLVKVIDVPEQARETVTSVASVTEDKTEAIREKIKIIKADIDEAKKEHQEVWEKILAMQEDLKPINDDLILLEEKLNNIAEDRNKAEKCLCALRKSHDEANSSYYMNCLLLDEAKELAAMKNMEALEQLAHTTVEAFMSEWNLNKTLREDYKKRIPSSLDSRKLSRDGRIIDTDDSLIFMETTQLCKATPEMALTNSIIENESVESICKLSTEVLNDCDTDIEETSFELSKPLLIDTEKLYEIRRDEEIAKAKLALERKKRLAEKAAVKAALRAQKEAEKKLKEKEKKAKKKCGGGSFTSSEDSIEMDTTTTEKLATTEKDEAGSAGLMKNKQVKKNSTYRSTLKSSNQIPKTILKRRRSQAYWTWAISGTILALVFVTVIYCFSSKRN